MLAINVDNVYIPEMSDKAEGNKTEIADFCRK